jgi:hypothetical protein
MKTCPVAHRPRADAADVFGCGHIAGKHAALRRAVNWKQATTHSVFTCFSLLELYDCCKTFGENMQCYAAYP